MKGLLKRKTKRQRQEHAKPQQEWVWEVAKAESESAELQMYLSKGWEPFGVVFYTGFGMVVFLRRLHGVAVAAGVGKEQEMNDGT